MNDDIESVPVLVPGPLNARALERIGASFTMLRLEEGLGGAIPPAIAEQVRGIGAIIPITAAMMDAFPRLEIIAHFGVGYDSIDVGHAASRGIMVTNTPGVLTEDVADLAVGLLINAIRDLPRAEAWLRSGKWASHGPYKLTPLTLRGRRVGIFGMGRVGLAVAKRLEAFGLDIAYHNRCPVPLLPYVYHASLIELAGAVDTLISVVPASAATTKAVDAAVLDALGPNGVFVNIGRGSTVDQPALIAALRERRIAAAALDVFANEPNVPDALLELDNATVVPHVGSATEYTRAAMADLCVDNLISWFAQGRALTAVPETAHLAPALKAP